MFARRLVVVAMLVGCSFPNRHPIAAGGMAGGAMILPMCAWMASDTDGTPVVATVALLCTVTGVVVGAAFVARLEDSIQSSNASSSSSSSNDDSSDSSSGDHAASGDGAANRSGDDRSSSSASFPSSSSFTSSSSSLPSSSSSADDDDGEGDNIGITRGSPPIGHNDNPASRAQPRKCHDVCKPGCGAVCYGPCDHCGRAIEGPCALPWVNVCK